MSHREAQELAYLRHQLRESLLARDPGAAASALVRLRHVASGDAELLAEHARWAFRFQLLAA
ncbi:MAG: hypothetical protein R3B06_28690 [Kofleriaceae bacterium]